jgi:glutamine synthetase
MISSTSLEPEELVFIGICDLAAQVRGKSVPAIDLPQRLQHGVGYTPANLCLSPFGTIGSTPFGTLGDIVLLPDASTKVNVPIDGSAPEHFYLADILTQKGERWKFCPRDFLRRALARLEKGTGCTLLASFEQEFVYTGLPAEPKRAYAHASYREQGDFGATLVAALRAAGMTPESFVTEFGPRQCEITVAPAINMRAADEAVILRELTRAVARRAGHRAIFSPMLAPEGVGNGTHIHMSLRDEAGNAKMHEPGKPYGLSQMGEHFIAGILEHMPALAAITTPSVCSYYRLTPDRWAPTWANVSLQDRSASLRVCPGSSNGAANHFNVEYRAADATACPYLALGALVHAGVDGIERHLTLPQPLEQPFASMSDVERHAAGMRSLPGTLAEAIGLLRSTPVARDWFGAEFFELYLNCKLEEEQAVAGLEPQDICDRYAAVF